MSTQPNVKYPKSVYIDKNILGGTVATIDLNRSERGQINQVIHVDCSDFDSTYTSVNPYIKDAIELSNGSKISLELYNDTYPFGQNTYPCVRVGVYGVKPNSNKVLIFNSTTGVITSGHIILTNIGLIKYYGIKLMFMTKYDSDIIVDLNSTEFRLYCLTPSKDPTGDSQLTGSNVSDHANLLFRTQDNNLYDEWVSAAGLAYGVDKNYGGLGLAFGDSYYSFDNLDTFNSTYLDLPQGSYEIIDPEDPVQDVDPSKPGGGGGGYRAPSDPIDFPNLPTGGALASRAVRAYCPTSQELYNLFQRLWDTSIFDIDTFQKLVDNPMDAIVSLHAIPVTPSIGSRALHVFIGNFNTEIAMDTIDNQYLTVDCGYINTEEFWGSALDYNPYTKSSIYLPFIGIKDLNTDDVMKKNIRVKYNIDVLNGDCVAFVKCGTAVLYKFSGSLKQDIPVTGQQSNVQLKGLQATLAEAGGAVMGGAIGGPMGAAIGAGAALSAASSVVSSKITTQRTGNMTGNHGILDDYRPYLIFHRPIQSLARDFKTFKGYPSNITAQLSSLRGYTEVEFINLGSIPNATDAEMDEIKNLLQNGVLL